MNRLLYTYIFNLKCYSSSSSLTTPLRQRLPPHTLPMPPQGDEALRRLAPHPPAQTRPAHRRPAPGKFRSLSLAPQEAPADRPSSAEDLTTLTRQRTLSNLVSLIISIVEISIMRRVQHILTSHAF
mmetsp:Transcript_8711/g.19756  ORF Transcript_8711/g.19756 Transcript_8711/m.19756 type:complete len:126 (-) Transcript_8711:828-1205(-)